MPLVPPIARLLQFMKKMFANEAEIELVEIKDLPMFNKPESKELPVQVTQLAEKITAADGVIISTPEYDHCRTRSVDQCPELVVLWNFPVC